MMNTRDKAVAKIIDTGVIAVIRIDNNEKFLKIINAIGEGGIRCIEITMTVPDPIDMIKYASKQVSPDFLLGAGTILDPETARLAILAGAEFVVTPTLNLDVIKVVHRYDKVVISGAFTPTEILRAWENGADIVKVFPATIGGPKYFKDLRGPLPQIRLTPTGGVTLENAKEFIKAGACCVGIGKALLDKKAIGEGNYSVLTTKASNLVKSIEEAKREINSLE